VPCTNPKKCWEYGKTKNGKPRYVFKRPEGYSGETQKVPCGKCTSCLIDKAKEWAVRGFHESQCHALNSFITLTYAEEYLPENGSLDRQHLRDFIKLMRYHFPKEKYGDWKYLAAGEYGSSENTHRPHHHICLFGVDFIDKEYLFTNEYGDPVFTSRKLEKIWKYGFNTVAPVHYRTVAYTARYTTKKIVERGQQTQDKFWIDTKTGETNYDPIAYKKGLLMKGKIPEFISMSPGIGKAWYEKYKNDTEKDYVTVNYALHKIPGYYDKLKEKEDPELLAKIKEKRKAAAIEIEAKLNKPSNDSIDRILKNKLKQLKRKI
jgi:hypothetical protein